MLRREGELVGDKRLMLGAFQSFGLGGSWRLPANDSVDFLQLDHWVTMAERLDQAGVDFLFFADDRERSREAVRRRWSPTTIGTPSPMSMSTSR